MLFQYKTTSNKGTGYWGLGALVVGIALPLKLLSPAEGFLAARFAPLMITLGLYLYLAGIWAFKEKKVKKWVVCGLPLIDLIQSLIFYYLFPHPSISNALHLGNMLIYCLISICELIQINSHHGFLKTPFRINALSYTLFFILILLKLATVLYRGSDAPINLTQLTFVSFTIASFLMIVLTLGFMSAVNIKFTRDLEYQITSKNNFFSIIAHDLSGSVGTISNFLNLLNNDLDFNETEKKKYLKSLESLSKSTFMLLQNLLNWARSTKNSSASNEEVVDLNQVIQSNFDFFESLTKFKSIQLSFNQGNETKILGNNKMIEAVMRNLISNATKFTPSKGQIQVTTLRQNDDKVRIRVKDTGIGMGPDKLKNITRFEKTISAPGTNGENGCGFGLALCKELIIEHQGTIQIESELNVGTEVILEFPAA